MVVVPDREAERGVFLEQAQGSPYEVHVYSDFLNPNTLP